MAKSKPHILIVDDKPDTVSPLSIEIGTKKRADVRCCRPDEVDTEGIKWAHLVLVDLDLEECSLGENIPLCCRARDGIALASVLRQHLRPKKDDPPTAFALLTGKIGTLADPLPPQHARHLLAPMHNLEWVFLKNDKRLADQVAILADAVMRIPSDWADGIQSAEEICGPLGLKKNDRVFERYQQDVEECHPPVYEFSQWTHGLAIVRWLLHRILVYPCFLWDEFRLAARLRLDPEDLAKTLGKKAGLWEGLHKHQYKGLLREFSGPRWWKSGVEMMVWDLTSGDPQNADLLRKKLSNLAGRNLKPSASDHPVVCVGKDYQPSGTLASIDDAVRIQPDDWPTYADAAWVLKKDAKSDPIIGNLVIRDDRDRLDR